MADQARPDDEPAPLRGEENLAVRIKLEREERGWSTTALSDRLNGLGYEINPSAVWRIENRKRRVNLDEAIGFAEVFGIALENLVGPPRLALHARAMELVEELRRRYRESRQAARAYSDATDALAAYVDEHPDINDEVDAMVANAIVEENVSLARPDDLLPPVIREERPGTDTGDAPAS
nr:helix-turn-helix transcriptional regulator [Streptomyces oceani]